MLSGSGAPLNCSPSLNVMATLGVHRKQHETATYHLFCTPAHTASQSQGQASDLALSSSTVRGNGVTTYTEPVV